MSKHFCMLAHKYDPKRVEKWPVAVEPKLDGVRVLVFVSPGAVLFRSRSDKPFPALDWMAPRISSHVADAFGAHASVVLEAEAVSGSFNTTVSSVRRKSVSADDAELYVFDIVPRTEFDVGKSVLPYFNRREVLARMYGLDSWPSFFNLLSVDYAHSHHAVVRLYRAAREQGLEGVMVKDAHARYERKRSHAWMKMKAEESVDVPVVGRFAGEGKHAGRLGGLIVKHGGVEVRVGTGFTDTQREELWECKFTQLHNRIVEVQYHEETPDGSLRHPRFVRFRDALTGAKE